MFMFYLFDLTLQKLWWQKHPLQDLQQLGELHSHIFKNSWFSWYHAMQWLDVSGYRAYR